MRDLCNTDKPLFAVLTKLTYSAYLNILWLVCSLPIVTIGASTTALFYVTLKMAEDRDDGLTRMFFKAFRENFKPATKLWLILLAVGSFLAADGFVLRRMWSENIFWTLLTAVLIGAAVLYGIVLLYAFPLLARFENTTFRHPENSVSRGCPVSVLHPADGGDLWHHGVRHSVCVHACIPAGHGLVRHALLLSDASDPLSDRWRP